MKVCAKKIKNRGDYMKDTVIVITGGHGGIGKIVVSNFLKQGAKVVVLDKDDTTSKTILENKNYTFIKTDVTKLEDLQNAHKIIESKYGYINYLISMAGINMKSEIDGIKGITFNDIDKSISLNLTAHIYLIKIMLDLIEKSNDICRRSILMISSINAITRYGLPAYSAAKSGIYGFMKSVLNELGTSNIRVNTISLGTVPHMEQEIEGDEYFENYRNHLPIKSFVRPTDVYDAIYSLLEIAKGVNGQNLVLDMGQSLR
jgi:short-chain dehydrogenase/reductase SDR